MRSVVLEGERLVCAGYTHSRETGFLFVAEGKPTVWELVHNYYLPLPLVLPQPLQDLAGGLVQESVLLLDWLGQVAKIRPDPAGGFVAGSTAWGEEDTQCVGLVKLDTNLEIEWSDCYGIVGFFLSRLFADILAVKDCVFLCVVRCTATGALVSHADIPVSRNKSHHLNSM